MQPRAVGVAAGLREEEVGILPERPEVVGAGEAVGAVSFDFSVLQNTAEDIQARYADLIVATATALSELLPPDRHD